MSWLMRKAVGVAGSAAGGKVLVGVAVFALACLGAAGLSGGLLLQAHEDMGRVEVERDQWRNTAKNNADQVEELKQDIARRDELDAALDSALSRIEGRFASLSTGIQRTIREEASDAYKACRSVRAPAGLVDRLRDGATGASSRKADNP